MLYNNSGMKRDLIRRLYFNDWVRIPTKFVLVFFGIKIGYDYYEYRTAWRTRCANPRSAGFQEQSPLEPYIPFPYPFYENYQQYMDLKRYFRLQHGIYKARLQPKDRYFIYFDAPCRESSNGIDRLFLIAKIHSTSEKAKFYFLNQLAEKQGSVPQGVYQEIRKIREPELEAESTLVPNL